jgi:hypothetical protein
MNGKLDLSVSSLSQVAALTLELKILQRDALKILIEVI